MLGEHAGLVPSLNGRLLCLAIRAVELLTATRGTSAMVARRVCLAADVDLSIALRRHLRASAKLISGQEFIPTNIFIPIHC
jgi:hypothetical protein